MWGQRSSHALRSCLNTMLALAEESFWWKKFHMWNLKCIFHPLRSQETFCMLNILPWASKNVNLLSEYEFQDVVWFRQTGNSKACNAYGSVSSEQESWAHLWPDMYTGVDFSVVLGQVCLLYPGKASPGVNSWGRPDLEAMFLSRSIGRM